MMKKYLIGLVLASALLVGCVNLVDPETGETLYGISPQVASGIDVGVEGVERGGPGLTAIITALNPGAGVMAGVAIGALTALGAAWKKWRTPLVEAGNKYDKLATGARVAADLIETVIKPNADLWKMAKPQLKAAEKAGATNVDKV